MTRGGWTEIWGELDAIGRLERELGLVAGRYRLEPTERHFSLTDPIYGESKPFREENLFDQESGKRWRVCITEITNGVYALLYQVAVPIFIVTDIESDGPTPLHNSMLSFASVAIEADGTRHGEFEAQLTQRPDRTTNETTMAWWATQPEAWAATTADAEAPALVMPRFADWVESLPGPKVFVAAPMIFDGLWMDHYLDEFAGTRVLSGPFKSRQIFRGGGVCLYTMAGTLRGADYLDWGMSKLPAEFYGHIAHTHKAIDDARGFAHVLVELFKISRALPPITGSKSDFR